MTETETVIKNPEEAVLFNEIKQMGVKGMFGEASPCNPIPFLRKLADGCRVYTDFIKTDDAQNLLHIINVMSYGEGAVIDLYKEFSDKYDRMCKRGAKQ